MSQIVESSRSVEPRTTADPVVGEPTRKGIRSGFPAAVGTVSLAVVALAFLAYGVRGGMPAANVVRALLAVALTQVLPGALVWRAVRPRDGWWVEDLMMGFAIGAVLAVGAQVLAGLTRLTWLSAAIALAVAATLLLVPVARGRILAARTSPLPWWWGPIVAATALVALPTLHSFFRSWPLSWSTGSRVPYIDAYHHLALASQLATRGPTRFPWVESEPVAYHWFSHAWVVQVSTSSGAGLDEVLFRFMPVLMPLVVVLTVAIAAMRLSGRPWAGPVAAILAMAGGSLNVFGELTPAYPITPWSPSLAFAAPMLIGAVVVLALRWRGDLPAHTGRVLLAVLCIGAAGSKGSTVPLILAGLSLAAIAMLVVDRPRLRGILGDLIIVAGCFLFVLATVFRGAGEFVRIDPAAAAAQTGVARWLGGARSGAVQTFVLMVAVTSLLARALGMLGLFASREGRRDPLTWLLVGASGAGAAAVGLLTHTHVGQYYFALSAIPIMAIGSTLGLAVVLDKLGASARSAIPLGIIAGPVVALAPVVLLGPLNPGGTRHAVAMLGVAIVVLVIIGVLASIVGSNRPQFIASVLLIAVLAAGVTVTVNSLVNHTSGPSYSAGVDEPGAVSRDQIDAARWIRENSEIDDLVVTNRHCVGPTRPRNCDSRRFVVTAFSERQVLVEGWSYTPQVAEIAAASGTPYSTVGYWRPHRLRLSDRFIADPTAEAGRELRELGVRWIFVDHTRPYAETLEPYAELRFRNPGVDVYELSPPSGD